MAILNEMGTPISAEEAIEVALAGGRLQIETEFRTVDWCDSVEDFRIRRYEGLPSSFCRQAGDPTAFYFEGGANDTTRYLRWQFFRDVAKGDRGDAPFVPGYTLIERLDAESRRSQPQ